MKQSHKLRAMGDVQSVVNASPDLTVAASRLGINRSTLTRWMQQGKVTRPGSLPAAGPSADVPATSEGWKAGVLAQHVLSDTERTLVDVAERALTLACDDTAAAFTRLSAMGRFAALVRQLNLDAKRVGAVKGPDVPARATAVRRVGADPRSSLMVLVK